MIRVRPRGSDAPTPASATPLPSEREIHDRIDPHRPSSSPSDVILGGQDGLANVLGVILGVAAATSEVRVVVVAGLAATFAESVSMAAVAYTSKRAEADRFKGEEARERRHFFGISISHSCADRAPARGRLLQIILFGTDTAHRVSLLRPARRAGIIVGILAEHVTRQRAVRLRS